MNQNRVSKNTNFFFRVFCVLFMSLAWGTHLQAADYYVDPLNGSMTNSGSVSSPWSTLESVFAANKTFVAGDNIYLRRGYHGGAIIKGNNSSMVTISAEAGHAPIFKWIQFQNARFWTIQDIFINPQVATADGVAQLILLDKSSTDNLVKNCFACSTQDPYGWRADEQGWLNNQKLGMHVKSGGRNHIDGVFFLNVGNGIFVNTTYNLIENTVIENYTRDGWATNGDYTTYQYNMILNAIMTDHTLDGNLSPTPRFHRDMVQSYSGGGKTGVVFRGNIFVSQADLSLPAAGYGPTTTGYMAPIMPAFAGWDGPFQDRVYENNVVFTDITAAIWLNNATNCTIVNNTLARVTSTSGSAFPLIRIIGTSSNNRVYNNIADGYDCASSTLAGGNTLSPSNITVKRTSYASTYLSEAQPRADVHLTASASSAINKARPEYAPALDADGNPRNGAPDIGAYEQGHFVGADTAAPSTPGKPRVIHIEGLGCDLLWTPATDNRVVAGYDIYRNNQKVARTRNGAKFFDLFNGTGSLSYTVKAFDRSGNFSSFSLSGTPDDTLPGTFSLTVTSGSGSGFYGTGVAVNVVANTPATNKIFDKWTGDVAGIGDVNSANTTYTMSAQNVAISATYKDKPAQSYLLTVTSGSGSGSYLAGNVISIVANTPATGKIFDKWTGSVSGVANVNVASTSITMPAANVALSATYTDPSYALVVTSGTGSGSYKAGVSVPIRANAAPAGKTFDQWTGDTAGVSSLTSATAQLVMPALATALTATYKNIPVEFFTLTITSGTGSGNYQAGSVVSLVANTPDLGKSFDQWTGDISGVSDVTRSSTQLVTQAQNSSITATYKDIPVVIKSLTVVNGTGSGNYAVGAEVDVVAADPAEGKVFDRWTGAILILADVFSATTKATIPNSNATVTALYKDLKYNLSVVNGSGDGSYSFATRVDLRADAPAFGKEFDEWKGDIDGIAVTESLSTVLIMPSANIEVSATYRYINPSDRDLDGMDNDWETLYGFNPDDPADGLLDTDGDGLKNNKEYEYGTNPTLSDTDNDGIKDGLEVLLGHSPTEPAQPKILSTEIQGTPVMGKDLVFAARVGHPGGKMINSYDWQLTSQPAGASALTDGDKSESRLSIAVAGDYVVSLQIVDENNVASDISYIRFTAYTAANLPPIADAGPDGQAVVGEMFKLYGINSSDVEDQKPAGYSWKLVKRPVDSVAVVELENSEIAQFKPDVAGVYAFHLQVTDSSGLKSTEVGLPQLSDVGNPGDALVFVRAVDRTGVNPPVAHLASTDVLAQAGQSVAVNAASSTDFDGGTLSYVWSFVTMPESSVVDFNNANAASPTFTPDMPGVYTANVIVSDLAGNKDVQSVVIQVEGPSDHKPSVAAGADQKYLVDSADLVVNLSGSAFDLDGDLKSTQWKQIEGPSVIINNPQALDTSFTIPKNQPRRAGLYRFVLEARDDIGLTDLDMLSIVVETANEHIPLIRLFSFPQLKNPSVLNKIILNGESRIVVSLDAMGDSGEKLTVFWTQTQGPSAFFRFDSEKSDDNIENEVLVINPKTAGDYVFKVYVDDGKPRSEDLEVSFKADGTAETLSTSVLDLGRVDVPASTGTTAVTQTAGAASATTVGAGFSGGGGCLLR